MIQQVSGDQSAELPVAAGDYDHCSLRGCDPSADTGTPAQNTAVPSAQLQQPRTANPQVIKLRPRSNLNRGQSQVEHGHPPGVVLSSSWFLHRRHICPSGPRSYTIVFTVQTHSNADMSALYRRITVIGRGITQGPGALTIYRMWTVSHLDEVKTPICPRPPGRPQPRHVLRAPYLRSSRLDGQPCRKARPLFPVSLCGQSPRPR